MSAIPTPITIVDIVAASPTLLEAVETSFDPAAELFNIPATPDGLRCLRGALTNGKLSNATQKRIALAIGNFDGRAYRDNAGFSQVERPADYSPLSEAKAQAAVGLAIRIAAREGRIEEADLAPVQSLGYTAGELLEIIGHVALNDLTNYIKEVFATEDTVPVAQAARAA